jgi:hypothetical protein
MKLSEKLTHRHLTVIALAVGISFPLYAMADTPTDADTSTKVVTQTTTTTVKHKHHRSHKAMHKSREAAENHADAVNNAKALNAEAVNGSNSANDANQGAEKRVIWKNGVIYHDVEPTGQAASGGFAAPASTSDTIQGGVTTTTSPAPK